MAEILPKFDLPHLPPNIRYRKSENGRLQYLQTTWGNITLDNNNEIIDVFVGGRRYPLVSDQTDETLSILLGPTEPIKELLGRPIGQNARRSRSRARGRARRHQQVDYDLLQQAAYEDMTGVRLTYGNLFVQLGALLEGANVSVYDIADELNSNDVPEEQLAWFLTHESEYAEAINYAVYGERIPNAIEDYQFSPIQADESFVGRVLTRLGETEAEYDNEKHVLKIGDRLITNLPHVDENGVFSNGTKRYIPYYIGYFVEDGDNRVERLRVLDPVEDALNGLALQYALSPGDVKFKTILDVTRNLIDFDDHVYGQEILETFKRKVVIDKNILSENSLYNNFKGKDVDGLGAVATMMLDEDAKGIIDPAVTSNGANMGGIFYLAKDAVINPDGSLTAGESTYSKIGDIIMEHNGDMDNFNRNQMSGNNLFISTNIKKMKVAYAEFGMRNAEDAVVLTKKGAERLTHKHGDDIVTMQTGDKISDMHGNKSVSSIIIDPDKEYSESEHMTYAQEFVRMNPDLDMIVSPLSLASRLNMGVAHEALSGIKQDLYLPNGEVIKDGIVEISYMSLPQTADHKSKDYSEDKGERKFSSLYRYALSGKIGKELYDEAFLTDDAIVVNISKVDSAFNACGRSFARVDNPDRLFTKHNVLFHVDAPVNVDANDFLFASVQDIRKRLTDEMIDGRINILLGDRCVMSPFDNTPIVDSQGRNVLPISLDMYSVDDVFTGESTIKYGTIPYIYNNVFLQLSLGNELELQREYARIAQLKHSELTRKDNIIKNLKTVSVGEGARTTMIIPDPTLGLNEVRSGSDDTHLLVHRDPCLHSSNVLAVKNVGNGPANVLATNPLIMPLIDGDYDSDTMGEIDFSALGLSPEREQELYDRACATNHATYYGEHNFAITGGHFKACALASGVDISHITPDLSHEEIVSEIENTTRTILDNPNSYGAYAVSFTDLQTIENSLSQLAEDGIKGKKEDIHRHLREGYTHEENVNVMKALIAKSEWTGVAGAITNNLIANLDENAPADYIQTAMDVTHSMTQSVLQLKKNADKLGEINTRIEDAKKALSGRVSFEKGFELLEQATEGLIPQRAIAQFVSRTADIQEEMVESKGFSPTSKFATKLGYGVVASNRVTTGKMAYVSGPNGFEHLLERLRPINYEAGDDYAL